MLRFVERATTGRQFRLLAVECSRLWWEFMPDNRSRSAVIAADQVVDAPGEEELQFARMQVLEVPRHPDPRTNWATAVAIMVASANPSDAAFSVLHAGETQGVCPGSTMEIHRKTQAALLRDILGNPFRPSPPLPPAVLAWNDGTVKRMAESIYEDRAFDRLPILADALLDAGCDDEELIRHYRSEGPHVRGCWAVDLLLGEHGRVSDPTPHGVGISSPTRAHRAYPCMTSPPPVRYHRRRP
jgi:hypothetical protein